MAHTPGPWKVEYDPYDDGTPYFRIVAGDQSSRDIKTMGFRLSGIMRADDAALIGASPDLLEILMEIPRAACRLAAVPGVTAAEVWFLARLAEVEATMFEIAANTDREASALAAQLRKPEQVLAVFRRDGADWSTFWVAELDAVAVEVLNEARQPGAPDLVEVYAATFGQPGDKLISVH